MIQPQPPTNTDRHSYPDSKMIVEIEYCQNCETHMHIGGHNYKKYEYFFQQVKKKLNPYGIAVHKKQKTPDLLQLLEMSSRDESNM